MPVQWRNVPIDFRGGIDTKTSDKDVLPGELLELVNGQLDKFGKIRKRKGFDVVSPKPTVFEDFVPVEWGPSIPRRDQLLRIVRQSGTSASDNHGEFHFRSEATDAWQEIGLPHIHFHPKHLYDLGGSSNASSTAGNAGNKTAYFGDVAMNDDFILYGFGAQSNQHLITVSRVTGEIVDRVTTTGLADDEYRVSMVKCVNTGTALWAIYSDTGANIRISQVGATGLITTLSTPITDFVSTAGAGGALDAVVQSSGNVVIAYSQGSPAVVKLSRINSSGSETATHTSTDQLNTTVYTVGVGVNASDEVFVAYMDDTATPLVRHFARSADLSTQVKAETTAETLGASTERIKNVTVVSGESSGVDMAYTIYDTSAVTPRIRVGSATSAAVTINVTLYNYWLASKIFRRVDDEDAAPLFLATQGKANQEAYCMFSTSASTFMFHGAFVPNGGARPHAERDSGFHALGSVARDPKNSQKMLFCGPRVFAVGEDLDKPQTVAAAFRIDLDHKPTCVEFADSVLFTSGCLMMWDGTTEDASTTDQSGIVEVGFFESPHADDITLTAASGGSMTSSVTYNFKVIYEWSDAQGRLHRSSPSAAKSVAMGASDTQVTVVVPTISATKKLKDLQVVVYRTEAGKSVYYEDVRVANSKTAATVSVVASQTDANLSDNRILYTDGGELGNVAPPPPEYITRHRGRVFGYGGLGRVYYTKEEQAGIGASFGAGQSIVVPTDDGDVVPFGMDDNLLLFSENRILRTAGQGPNNLGQGGYPAPVPLAATVGCVNAGSLISTALGVFFKSHKGLYLLDRGLSAGYIGAKVEGFNTTAIDTVVLHKTIDQIWFYLADGETILTYDFQAGQWGTHKTPLRQYPVGHKGVSNFFDRTGRHFRLGDGYQDGSENFNMKIGTAWIQLAGPQGYKRVRRFAVLGSKRTNHKLHVRVYYDFETEVGDEFIFDTEVGIPAGSDVLQFRERFGRQKCQAIRFEIEDEDQSESGEGYEISGLTIEAAPKSGIRRMGAAARAVS